MHGPNRENQSSNRLQLYILSSLFAALTAAGAFIKIPLPYVPITLQTFFVILSGTVLGAKFGALSQLIYISAGLLGAPIFAYGGGLGYIFHPTFGYLLGCPVGAYIIGFLVKNRGKANSPNYPGFIQLCISSFWGVLFILVLGALVLYLNFKYIINEPISLNTLLVSYFLVFIPGDIVKIVLGAFTSLKLFRVVYVYR